MFKKSYSGCFYVLYEGIDSIVDFLEDNTFEEKELTLIGETSKGFLPHKYNSRISFDDVYDMENDVALCYFRVDSREVDKELVKVEYDKAVEKYKSENGVEKLSSADKEFIRQAVLKSLNDEAHIKIKFYDVFIFGGDKKLLFTNMKPDDVAYYFGGENNIRGFVVNVENYEDVFENIVKCKYDLVDRVVEFKDIDLDEIRNLPESNLKSFVLGVDDTYVHFKCKDYPYFIANKIEFDDIKLKDVINMSADALDVISELGSMVFNAFENLKKDFKWE